MFTFTFCWLVLNISIFAITLLRLWFKMAHLLLYGFLPPICQLIYSQNLLATHYFANIMQFLDYPSPFLNSFIILFVLFVSDGGVDLVRTSFTLCDHTCFLYTRDAVYTSSVVSYFWILRTSLSLV